MHYNEKLACTLQVMTWPILHAEPFGRLDQHCYTYTLLSCLYELSKSA